MKRRHFLQYIALAAGTTLHGGNKCGASGAIALTPVRLSDGPKNRGRIHGETLRPQIRELLSAWRAMLRINTGHEPEAVIHDILSNTRYREVIAQHTPELWLELEGIAEAAEVPLDDLFVFNLPDEQLWYLNSKTSGHLLDTPEKCTTLGFLPTETTPSLIGQNMDIPSASKGFGALLDIRDERTGVHAYVFTIAGLIGIVGMNNQPVGVANNSLRQLDGRVDGLPVNFVSRGLLEHTSGPEAIAFLKRIPHANGHNWMIGDRNGVRSFECSAHSVVEFDGSRFPGTVYHTNHPFVNTDTHLHDSLRVATPAVPGSSEARCAMVEQTLERHDGAPPSVSFIKSVLTNRDNAEYPVCRPHCPDDPEATYTAASLIMVLNEQPTLHFAPGPPSETDYEEYGWR